MLKKLFTLLFALLWSTMLIAQISEVDPNGETHTINPEAPGDILYTWDIDALTGETGNLGVEYAFGYLWVTSRGLVSPLGNKLTKIDVSNPMVPVVVDSFTQGNSDAWGWRDLCNDGTFLYASVTNMVEQIDPATGLVVGSFPGVNTPNRALAYDPATDHFWTASFTSDLWEFDRTGAIINQFPSAVSMYGAAWDNYSPGGPYLWAHGDPTSSILQIDPVTGTLTGLSYVVSALGADGGMSISADDLVPGKLVAVCLSQEGPPDLVIVVELGDYIIPVELASFTASVNEKVVTLNWVTASEINNSGFQVERKSTGEYETIGFVPGFGTTTETKSYSFSDANLNVGTYSYRLKQIDFDGTSEYSDVVEVDVTVPDVFALEQNYPNPFNPSTQIDFSLAADSKVTLNVFSLLGEKVATIVNSNLAAGSHQVDFNAANLNSGVYFYRIEAIGIDGTNFTNVKKMILTK